MIANYQSSSPHLNNFSQAVIWGSLNDPNYQPTKAKAIGFNNPHQAKYSISNHKQKTFYTAPIYEQFKDWSFEQFEEQYKGQIELCDQTIIFLKKIGQPLSKIAEQQTVTQHHDFLFLQDLAFPISDIYSFFAKTGHAQIKNQQLFQKATQDNPTVLDEIKNIEHNQSFLSEEDDPEEITKLKGQTGPINFSFNYNGNDVQVNMEELIKIAGYTFHPTIRGQTHYVKWQEDVIYNYESRFIVILGSRQGGKSHVMGLRGLLSTFKGYRQDTLVCAFTNETTDHIKKYILRLIENYPEGIFVESKKKGWITNTLTGSRIIFRSLSEEAARIRGWTLNEIIMDECYLVADEVFESVLMPTLSTTEGTICMLSTPGPKNWFYWEVMKARQKEESYAYYQFTLDENPFIGPQERARLLKKKDDPIIQREYFCKFDEGGNAIFRPYKTEDFTFYNNYHKEAHFVLAYDPARQGKDRAGYTCFMVCNNQTFILKSGFIPDAYKKGSWELQYQWFEENIFNDGHDWRMVMDATGVGNGAVEIFQKKRKIDMVVIYTSGNQAYEDTEDSFGNAEVYRVGKSLLINNTQNYLDERTASFFKYTNEELFFEMDAIIERRTSMGMAGFYTKGFDDITNSCMIGLFFIEQKNLLTKKIQKKEDTLHTISQEPYFQTPKKAPAFNRRHGSHW